MKVADFIEDIFSLVAKVQYMTDITVKKVHSQSPNNGILKNNGVYFLVNLLSCHARVLNWAMW